MHIFYRLRMIYQKIMGDSKPKEEPILYEFACSSCNLAETADYKGTSPPFSRNIDLKYPSYVMKDPFSPPGKGEILVLGADCVKCNKPVCIGKDCSLFYLKMYCLDCAQNSAEEFPVEIKSKIAQIKRK
ncbi:cysteine-rich DPF motif domain-containing protein 1 [Cydia pomonella]|uniref:cysteine-rich DPF motif domain-containing protein 1 n=1 Tax=Cydia pomonella TaxID=82600 RepID=UPI002ADD5257|nr:cysteine-rich DPF motif domain-containing protein 1 [Cydia pomonella]